MSSPRNQPFITIGYVLFIYRAHEPKGVHPIVGWLSGYKLIS